MGEGCLQFLKDAQIAQKESKVTFCNESYSKLVQKKPEKNFVALFLNLVCQKYNKTNNSKHFGAILQSNKSC